MPWIHINERTKVMFSIQQRPIVVFDCETTGLDPKKDTIIELGAVKLVGNQKVARYHQLFNPQIPLSEKVIEITGITDDMLVNQPTLAEKFGDFLEFIKGSILVAHNLSFDYNFIYYAAKKLEKEVSNKGICTLLLAQYLFPRPQIQEYKRNPYATPMPNSHKLGDLSAFLQIPLQNAHRADEDALATARLFWLLVQEAKKKDISILFDIVKEQDEILKEMGEKEKHFQTTLASPEQLQYVQSLMDQVKNCSLKKNIQQLKKSEAHKVIETLLQYKNTGVLAENEFILSTKKKSISYEQTTL